MGLGHYLMFNDAELYAVVILFVFCKDLDGLNGVQEDLWSFYGDQCQIRPQKDNGNVLQTQIHRCCFNLYLSYPKTEISLGCKFERKHHLCCSRRVAAFRM